MDEKESREAEISARIAAIRAANEERERRHAEVEADKKLAEKKKSAVDVRNTAAPETASPGRDRDLNFGPKNAGNLRRPQLEKTVPSPSRASAQDRLRRGAPDLGKPIRSRMGENDRPPPDPGYSFLADRMRDEDDEEDEESFRPNQRPDYVNSRPDFGNSRPDFGNSRPDFANRRGPAQGPNRFSVNSRINRSYDDRQRRQMSAPLEGRPSRPPHPFGNGSGPPDFTGSHPNRSVNSGNFSNSGFTSQEPLADRSFGNNNPSSRINPQHRRVKEESKGLKIEVQFDKMSNDGDGADDDSDAENDTDVANTTSSSTKQIVKNNSSSKLSEVVTGFQEFHPTIHMPQQQVPVVTAPANSWTTPIMTTLPVTQWTNEPPPPFTQTQPAHWSHQQEQHQPLVDTYVIGTWGQPSDPTPQQNWTGDWSNDTEIGDWSEEVNYSPAPAIEGMPWVAQHQGYTTISAAPAPMGPPPVPFMHNPYTEPLMIPIGTGVEMLHHQHQTVTQITQHSLPIMATQQFIPNRSQPHFYNSNSSSRSSLSSFNRFSGNSNDSRRQTGSSNQSWREREVTKIPPRFQKQKMPVRQVRRNLYNEQLPRATSASPPTTCRRISIFAASSIINSLSEDDLVRDLGLSVQLIPTSNCLSLRENIGLVDPALDRFVLVHTLADDALAIAMQQGKTDLERGADSDQVALDFAETITNLTDRIPYLTVFVSTLLPRFDVEDHATMSNPNNVRKVMNVEISSRLTSNSRVIFINNDLVLEWWKDDVKRNRLFASDGQQLTPYGFSVLLDHWMVTLKEEVSKASVTPRLEEHVLSPRSEDSVEPELNARLSQIELDSQPMEEHVLSESKTPEVKSKEPDSSEKTVTESSEVLAESEGSELINDEAFSAEKSSITKEDILPEHEAAVEVEVKPEDVSLGPDDDDDLDEHKVEEVDVSTDKEDFREKDNDELMEKELAKKSAEES